MSILKTDINAVVGLGSDVPVVFLIEKMNTPLTSSMQGDHLKLEGICAEFGVENNNKRIYEKEEYLPHLEYLNAKIERGNLYGELDHPQNYDITLKNVSHLVEGLRYDSATDTVKIKIRVLDTPMGKIVKSLVESGCTVSISSRAAGQINEGKVKLHKIFTYDVVGEAGFQRATLGKAFESAGFGQTDIDASMNLLTENAAHCITNELVDISESLGFSGLKAYTAINTPSDSATTKNTTPVPMPEDLLKKEEFQRYSVAVKNKFKSLNESINTATAELPPAKVKAYLNHLAKVQNQILEKLDQYGAMLDKNIRYTEDVAEKVGHSINYSMYLKEMLNFNINFSNSLAETQNTQIGHTNLIATKLNEAINHNDHIGGVVNNVIKHNNRIAKTVNEAIDFANIQSTKINETIAYAEHVGGILDKFGKWSDSLVENLNSGYNPVVDRTQKILDQVKQIDEKANLTLQIDENSSVQQITESVNKVLDLVANASNEKVLENQYPFLKFLSQPNREQFYNLDSAIKSTIVDGMRKAVWTNESEVVNIMNNLVAYAFKDVPNYVRLMPAEFKDIYEAMTPEEKTYLNTKSQNYVINTQYQAKNFWNSHDFFAIQERIRTNELAKTNQLNESQSKEGYISLQQVSDIQRGYSQDYVERMNRYANR